MVELLHDRNLKPKHFVSVAIIPVAAVGGAAGRAAGRLCAHPRVAHQPAFLGVDRLFLDHLRK